MPLGISGQSKILTQHIERRLPDVAVLVDRIFLVSSQGHSESQRKRRKMKARRFLRRKGDKTMAGIIVLASLVCMTALFDDKMRKKRGKRRKR